MCDVAWASSLLMMFKVVKFFMYLIIYDYASIKHNMLNKISIDIVYLFYSD